MHINERLKFIRESRNITQTQIEKDLNINRVQYQKWESGKNVMSAEYLKILCEYFNVSADYILGLPKGMNYPPIG